VEAQQLLRRVARQPIDVPALPVPAFPRLVAEGRLVALVERIAAQPPARFISHAMTST
jgi:hypothetical protein